MLRLVIKVSFLSVVSSLACAQHNMGTGSAMELFERNCASCHGSQLQGGGIGGSLVDDQWRFGSSDDTLFEVIKHGRLDVGMPAWQTTLSDEQIRSLVILIREQQHLVVTGENKKALDREQLFTSDRHHFRLQQIGEGTNILWGIDFLPNGDILATQQDGILWHFSKGQRNLISNIPEVLFVSQGGLLDVKVHPDYQNNGWVYLSFSEASEQGSMTAVVRGKIEGDLWSQEERIFNVSVDHHINTTYHYGSRLAMSDHYLFFSIGDRGEQAHAQDISRPNGKIHRLYDDGRVPEDNPFFGQDGAWASIWSYGHRNPQGLTFHPETEELWSSELGPRGGDEINIIHKGGNYGWPEVTHGMNYDGTAITDRVRGDGVIDPLRAWTPSISPGGIAFYRGQNFPGWLHNLFVAGMGSEQLHRLVVEKGRVIGEEVVMAGQGRIRDVAVGPDGYLYLILNTRDPVSSKIYRIIPVGNEGK